MIFNINPIPAPRMVRSDKWKKRECVTKYYNYCNELRKLAIENNFQLGNNYTVIFCLKMPDSWSNKKKDKMNNKPHDVKPDWDNLVKAFQDALCDNDSKISSVVVIKRWSYEGKIMCNNNV